MWRVGVWEVVVTAETARGMLRAVGMGDDET